ncbi:MAG: hypothetical protein MZU95_03310 [Desulfomicrobium escambiense]|nr:hypothetical protein [Desulfomicrobium escambiense]
MIERGAVVVRGIQFQASHGASARRRRDAPVRGRPRHRVARSHLQGGETDRLADTVDYLEICAW